MDKAKKALDVQRSSFSRLVNHTKEIIAKGDFNLAEIRANSQLLDQKIDTINELDRLVMDFLLNSEENTDVIEAEMKEADKYSLTYHQLKFEINSLFEKPCQVIASTSRSELSHHHLNLPKIEFKKFGGDPKEWILFWSQFQRIHDDISIEVEDKFHYLIQATVPNSRPRILVESYPPTKENYPKVIDSLKSRFGRKDLLVEVYVREILKLVLNSNTKRYSLSTLYDKLESQLRALETFDVKTDTCAAMLYPLVESSLTEDLIRTWHRSSLYDAESSVQERLENLMKFLKKEVQDEEKIVMATSGFELQYKSKRNYDTSSKSANNATTAADLINRSSLKCVFCKSTHDGQNCTEARTWSLAQKKEKLSANACCHLCMKFGHIKRRCRVKLRCSKCQGRHVDIMCPKNDEQLSSNTQIVDTPIAIVDNSLSNLTFTQVFLQTLSVQVIGENKTRRARLIIDTGSQKSYILKSAVVEMGFQPIRQEDVIHSLFGGTQTEIINHNCYRIRLSDLENSYFCNFETLDQPVICNNICSVVEGPWIKELHSLGINLSDTKAGPIEILIGADIAGKLFTGNKYQLKCGLVAMETLLGWTIMGKLSDTQTREPTTCILMSMLSKDSVLSELWRLDVLGIDDPVEHKSRQEREKDVMKYFLQTVSRHEDGRYEVCLPFLEGHPPIPSNFNMAYQRLINITKKLKEEGYYADYQQQFDDWLTEGIIEEVFENNYKDRGHYLPHRHVVKLSSLTTKIRPVFDASAREKNQPSLNQCLEKGVNLIELIPSILLRFRMSQFGVVADIRKAFLQISLQESDRDFLRFLWYDRDGNLKIYRHARIVFGVTCSPFLLGAVINYHLENAVEVSRTKSLYSPIIQKLLKGFYVDNCITSVESEEVLNQFIFESTALLEEAKFDLRAWEHTDFTQNLTNIPLTPVLGLLWNRHLDSLELSLEWINKINAAVVTKRSILSVVNKIFDPIGFSCPVSLLPKLLLQKSWILKIGWDEVVEEDMHQSFSRWFNELPLLVNLKIPRWFFLSKDVSNLTLHVFNDASKHAYATSIFLRCETSVGVNIQLVQAKTRVAPVKKLSIPRLELLAATIGVRLSRIIIETLDLNFKVYYWSDSTTVLTWIKREEQWKPFVWNRVLEIRRLSNANEWYHVPGNINPSDLPSRGCSPKHLLDSRWWEGPMWLRNSVVEWPNQTVIPNEDAVNMEKKQGIASSLSNFNNNYTWYYSYFSDYSKIIRLVGWIRRYLTNLKRKNNLSDLQTKLSVLKGNVSTIQYRYSLFLSVEDLSVEELEASELTIIRLIQKENFMNIDDPKISTLIPFIDDDGLIRIKTKISEREDTSYFRFPYVLPSKHEVVYRLIFEQHVRNLHAGVQIMMSKLRERFWILKCRQTVRSVLSKCKICRRYNSKKLNLQSPPLPLDRVREAAVFEIVGVDLTGPLYIRNAGKVWVAIYTCAVFRAIHLDDNAKNFVGANNAFEAIDWTKVEEERNLQRITWKWIPPTAAWWGGWWERLIRIVKDILRRVLGRSYLVYEELLTIIYECESIINSRPLTYVSEDFNDLVPLTPAMFFQDNTEIGVLDLDQIEQGDIRRHHRHRLKLREDLRKRFRNEYLGQLSLFKGRKASFSNFKVDDIVLIGNDKDKRLDWPLGRIENLIPGRDGKVRLVKLRTATGTLLRPIQRLYPLEMSKEDGRVLKEKDGTDKREYKTRSGRISKPPSRFKI